MRRLLRPVLLLTPLIALAGCSASAAPDMQAMPPPTVTVSVPVVKTVTDYAEFTGRTAAVEAVKLRARVWGHLEKINFVEGSEVKQGDLLFVIDQRPYQAALARADADVAMSEARATRLGSEHKRAQVLLQNRAISREEFDKVVGDEAEAQGAVRSAQAARLTAKLNLDFTEVKAPIAGQISRAMVTTGNMVSSGETGGTVLSTIMSIDPMYAYFDVDDTTSTPVKELLDSAKGQGSARPKVFLARANDKGFPREGYLDFADNQVDAGTGTMRMRGVFRNPKRDLTPGMFVRVRVPLGQAHEAVLVSDRAVDTDQGQKIVFVVASDNKVEKRDVRLGKMHGGLREVLSGVSAGDRVIVDGIQRVRPGVPVTPKAVEMPVTPEH